MNYKVKRSFEILNNTALFFVSKFLQVIRIIQDAISLTLADCDLFANFIRHETSQIREMLKRLVILNSEIYAKADIDLNDCHNLQIVGPNNIGKSTLIYALNFLYIIDGRQMSFSGNRTGDRTTINHYFPTTPVSYIVFEIFKKRYYCILVRRNAEGSLDYYKIDSDFKDEHYMKNTPQGQVIKKFDELQI